MPKANGSKNVILSPPAWNRVDEAVEHWQQQKRLGESTPSIPAPLSTDCIKLKNNSGGDLLRGAALQIQDDLLTSESQLLAESLWFAGITATVDNKPFGITRQAMKSGKIDTVQVSGVCIARVNITDESHERAYLKAGETNLQSSRDGSVQILWKPSGTGVLECVALLHNPLGRELIRFAMYEDMPALGGEALAYKVEWTGAAYEQVGATFTVKDYTGRSWRPLTGHRGWAYKPRDNDDDKYEIVWVEMLARYIQFTSTEKMGATIADQMAVTVNAYWHGVSPGSSSIVHDPQGHYSLALDGSTGVAKYNETLNRYEVERCRHKALWVRSTLANDVASGESDGAGVDDWGGSGLDTMYPGNDDDEVDLKDKDNFCKHALVGSQTFSLLDKTLDEYLMLIAETKAGIVEFTLGGPFTGSPPSASGTIGLYYGSQLDFMQPAGGGSSVTIYDEQNMFPRTVTGAKGKAFFDWVANKYRAIYCEQVGITATASLSAALTGGSTASITGFTITSPTPFNLSPSTTPTSASNPYKHYGLSGAAVQLAWNGSTWDIVDIARVTAKTILLYSGTGALRISGGKLQGYMVDTAVEIGATPTWTDCVDGTEC